MQLIVYQLNGSSILLIPANLNVTVAECLGGRLQIYYTWVRLPPVIPNNKKGRCTIINVYFIADLHFGHKNIVSFCRPQFQDHFEMADQLVVNWNKVVKPKDVVYVLGDVAFGKDNLHYLAQLNGRKHLVMGNHDVYAIKEYTPYFDHIWGCNNYKGCILTHVPIIESQFYRWKLNIHGHVHCADDDEKLRDDPRYFNVCADSIDLTPIAWEEIKERTKLDFIPRRIIL